MKDLVFLTLLMLTSVALAFSRPAGVRADSVNVPPEFAPSTSAESTLYRPIFTRERNFVIEAPSLVETIQDDSLPVTLSIFDDALKSCSLDLDTVHGQIGMMLSTASAAWQALDLIFPGSLTRIQAKGVHIVIDDFSQFAGNNPEYASYFIHDSDGPVIGLDCSSQLARSYWLPSITHELTHAMLDGAGDESWWEEALAQQMEHEVGGEQPDLSAGNLAQSASLPSLLDPRRPLPSHESYGITYLFAKYLRQEFGGWSVLQAMAQPSGQQSGQLSKETADFLTQIAGQAHARLQTPTESLVGQSASELGADKLTREGLLRYFYVALTMNNSKWSEYSIQDWQGLKAIPLSPEKETLAVGQASVFQNLSDASLMNPLLETYRVLVDKNGIYQILPVEASQGKLPGGSQVPSIPAGFQVARDFFLSLNLTEVPQALLQN